LIFKERWDNLLGGDGQKTLGDKIKEEFTMHVPTVLSNRKSTHFPPAKLANSEFTSIHSLQNLANPTKNGLSAKNQVKKLSNDKPANKLSGPVHLYVQVLSTPNIREILKLLDKKIKEIHRTMNKSNVSSKL